MSQHVHEIMQIVNICLFPATTFLYDWAMPGRIAIILFLLLPISGWRDADIAGQVIDITTENDLVLANGGTVKLAGVDMASFPAVPNRLRDLAVGEDVRLTSWEQDRHGRFVAMVTLTNRQSLQASMLSEGLARLIFSSNPASLQRAEQTARDQKLGIWSQTAYRIKTPDELENSRGRFEIVRGRIRNAAHIRGVIYLNFGEDWREDFTIRIDRRNREAFEGVLARVDGLSDQQIEVRGRVRYYNGPMIDLYDPRQILYIDEGAEGETRRETDEG